MGCHNSKTKQYLKRNEKKHTYNSNNRETALEGQQSPEYIIYNKQYQQQQQQQQKNQTDQQNVQIQSNQQNQQSSNSNIKEQTIKELEEFGINEAQSIVQINDMQDLEIDFQTNLENGEYKIYYQIQVDHTPYQPKQKQAHTFNNIKIEDPQSKHQTQNTYTNLNFQNNNNNPKCYNNCIYQCKKQRNLTKSI